MPAITPNCPKVSYGTGPTVLLFSLPCRPWKPMRPSVGGIAWSAAGVPADYEVRKDADLAVTLRVKESELSDVYAWIEGVRAPITAFTFWPDQDVATSYSVYLASPASGEDPDFQRYQSPDDGAVFDLPVVFRKVTSSAWTDAYYP